MKRTFLSIVTIIFMAANTLPAFAAVISPYSSNIAVPVNPPPKAISDALSEFRHLSRKDRKLRIREAKAEIKKFKAEKKAGKDPTTDQLLLVILAILIPPLAVYLHEGEINGKFWLDLILTLLFFLPGVIYALIVVLT